MLSELRIENLLLITRAHVEFVGGLNVFSGETGAGKSMLVDAIEFLLGARGDAGMVRPGAAQAEVFARFVINDRELIEFLATDLGIAFEPGEGPAELVISRAMPRTGRPRAHANGRPIAIPALKELGDRLLDIHGQHENQSLLRPATRLEIIDRFGEAWTERATVRRLHSEAHAAAVALAELRRAARNRQGRQDMMRFQLKEMEEANLDAIDPATLESDIRLLRGAEKVRAAAAAVSQALDGDDDRSAAVRLGRALKMYHALGDIGSEANALGERLDTLLTEIQDAARDADDLADKAKSDPQRLSELEDAQDRIKSLQRKHGRDLEALKALYLKLKSDLDDLDRIDARTEEREAALSKAVEALAAACQKLARKRKAAASDLERRVAKELNDLGFKDAKLQIVLTPNATLAPAKPIVAPSDPLSTDDGPTLDDEAHSLLPASLKQTGSESADVLFSANPELPPRPLKECASGGELARVMLALKGVLARVAGADRLPVVVFDEVDQGVGGRLGGMIGKKLAELAGVRQVLCVTHQPQLAAYAARQLKVEKKREGNTTLVTIECLEGQRRVDEIAMMLRGAEASENTRAEAAAMLREAKVK